MHLNGKWMSLRSEAESRGIRIPVAKTLRIYGITENEWIKLLKSQDWKCAVCRREKATWNTDHEHIPGWKKLTPNQRRIYVRGILCWYCNRHVVDSNLSVESARRLTEYLEKYESRRNAMLIGPEDHGPGSKGEKAGCDCSRCQP